MERFSKVIKIQEVILQSERLAGMPADSRLLGMLDKGVKSMLGGQLADHCQIGKIEGPILTYYVDSPIWAHTFRMSKNLILSTLQAIGCAYDANDKAQGPHHGLSASDYIQLAAIEDIKLRVRPHITRSAKFRKPRKALPKLSITTANSIEETAKTLVDKEVAEMWAAFAVKHRAKTQSTWD